MNYLVMRLVTNGHGYDEFVFFDLDSAINFVRQQQIENWCGVEYKLIEGRHLCYGEDIDKFVKNRDENK